MHVRDYALGDKLGEGAFGATYAATRTGSDEAFVIKRIAVRGLGDWKPVERLEREAEVLRSLEHPGVVRFVDAFEAPLQGDTADEVADAGPQFCLVSERVPGETLGQKIERRVRWTEASARALLVALLETLRYLHTLSPRVVHRDIKPGNVVIKPDGSPVLVDFGSVLDLASRGPDGGPTFAGTAGYMSPEQAMGVVDPRSDLYGLGTTMLHVLTHQHPADLPRSGLRFDVRDRLGVSDALHQVLMRLVEPDPNARFGSAEEALAALQPPSSRSPALGPPSGAAPPYASLMPLGAPASPYAALAMLSGTSGWAPAPPTALAPRPPAAVVAPSPRPASPAIRSVLVPARTQFAGPPAVPTLTWGAVAMTLGMMFLGLGGLVAPMMFVLIPAFAMLASLRVNSMRETERIHRAAALYRNGTATVGRLTWGWFHPHCTSVRYHYQVGARVFVGALETTDVVRSRTLRHRDPVHVFFDPSDPSVHVAVLDYELREIQNSAA